MMRLNKNEPLELCCVSYVAPAQILQIEQYPEVGYGTEIFGVHSTVAADGTLIALTCSHLGLKVGLIGNQIGADSSGVEIANLLIKSGVHTTVETSNRLTARAFTLVICDRHGKRTWFSHLPDVREHLLRADLTMISKSKLAYIDLYPVIKEASLRAIEYSTESQVPIFLNLGGGPLTSDLENMLANKGIVIVQTDVDGFPERPVEEIATQILDSIQPEVVLITLPDRGVVQFSSEGVTQGPIYKVKIMHTHGPGAALSAGYIFAYLNHWTREDSLKFGCALRAMSCTVADGFRRFSTQDVLKFIQEHSNEAT